MPNSKIKSIRAALVILTVIVLFSIGLSSCKSFSGNTKDNVATGEEIEVEIKEGMGLKEIASILEEKKVIDNAFLFRLFVEQKEKEGSLIPGIYTMKTGSDYDEVLSEITAGPPIITYKFTIPEGFTSEQIAVEVSDEIPFIDYEDMEEALDIGSYDYGFLEGADRLEGFLFPKTYEITVDFTAGDVIDMMLSQYQYETGSLDYSIAESKNLSGYDILIIASMIEREAYIPEERAKISAVIHNRLDIGMKLEIDATLSYFLNKWEDELTVSDLETDTEYNTRLYAGLPPTPICNPGLESIEAALNPADVDFIYFKVTDTDNHIHSFFNADEYQDFVNAEVK